MMPDFLVADGSRSVQCVPRVAAGYTVPRSSHKPDSSSLAPASDLLLLHRNISSTPFSTTPNSSRGGKIRVGFLSYFFHHHSVGLLLQGVITHLNR